MYFPTHLSPTQLFHNLFPSYLLLHFAYTPKLNLPVLPLPFSYNLLLTIRTSLHFPTPFPSILLFTTQHFYPFFMLLSKYPICPLPISYPKSLIPFPSLFSYYFPNNKYKLTYSLKYVLSKNKFYNFCNEITKALKAK